MRLHAANAARVIVGQWSNPRAWRCKHRGMAALSAAFKTGTITAY